MKFIANIFLTILVKNKILKMDNNMVTFEKKWLDKLIPMRFKINYWLLKNLGLEGFRIVVVLGGALLTIIIYEFLM